MTSSTDRRLRRVATVSSPVVVLASAAYMVAGRATQAELVSVVVVPVSFLGAGLIAWARRPGPAGVG